MTPVLTTSCDGKRVKIANLGIACSCLLRYNQALSMDCKATDISTIKTATSSSGKHSAQICRMMAEVAGASFDGFRICLLYTSDAADEL